jgi:hypothetical protein
MQRDLQFATVEIHTSPWEAHVSRGLVESEGIPAFLASEHHVWAIWPMSLALGGVRLKVPVEHASQALAVLARRNSGEFEAALLEQLPFKGAACRECGSTTLREEHSWSSILLSLCFLFVGSAIFPPPKERKCATCGGAANAEP